MVARHGSCCGPSHNPHKHGHSPGHETHTHSSSSDELVNEQGKSSSAHAHEHQHTEDCSGLNREADHNHDLSHEHTHAHGHHHHHHHHGGSNEIASRNPVYWLVHAVMTWTGLGKLAAWLEGSRAATLGMVACFVGAASAQLLLSQGLLTGSAGTATAALEAGARVAVTAGAAGVLVLGGLPECVELCYATAAGAVDTHVLMTLAAVGAYAMGAALEGALLLVLFRLSQWLEHELTSKAAGSLDMLLTSCPQNAMVVQVDGQGNPIMSTVKETRAADVGIGSTVLIRPGEQVPLDGEVVYGAALVSAEHITGEALPIAKGPGQQVAAGSLDHDGMLLLRTTRKADDSTPARIARMTSSAQAAKPQLRRWIDSFGEWYSRAVIYGTLGAALVMLLSGVPLLPQGSGAERGVLYRAMGMLTVASPCALAMVPLAYVAALAAITRRGLLLKGTAILDALASCTTVAFDKTGTLTSGSLSVAAVIDPAAQQAGGASVPLHPPQAATWDHALDNGQALAAAVALSQRSTHPISRAIVRLPDRAASVEVSDFKLTPGAGVQGVVAGRFAQLGAAAFVRQALPQDQAVLLDAALEREGAVGGAVSVLALHPGKNSTSSNGPAAGAYELRLFVFEDSVRQRSKAAVQVLSTGAVQGRPAGQSAMQLMMLTGDNAASATRVGRMLGISDVRPSLAPEQKLDIIAGLAASNGRMQMQGLQQAKEEALANSHDHTHAEQGHVHSHAPDHAHDQQHHEGCTHDHGHHQTASSQQEHSTCIPVSGSVQETSLLWSALNGLRTAVGAKTDSGSGGVIMVGDGINDAPALAAATVGMAVVSTPADAAAGAADVLCLNRDPISSTPYLLAMAYQTRKIVAQNMVLAAGSVLALVLPTVCGLVPLWLAVSLHEGTTVLVALNSLRLLAARPHEDLMAGAYMDEAASVETPQLLQQPDCSTMHSQEVYGPANKEGGSPGVEPAVVVS